jgi:hypothetical protein
MTAKRRHPWRNYIDAERREALNTVRRIMASISYAETSMARNRRPYRGGFDPVYLDRRKIRLKGGNEDAD